MQIDAKLLCECPNLSEYEKDLIRRVDINHESQSSVAKLYDKTRGTVCSQRKKALEKFNAWFKLDEQRTGRSDEDFDKECFKLFGTGLPPNKVVEQLGHADSVFRLWEKYRKCMQDDYVAALNILVPWIKKEKCREYSVEQYPLAACVQKLRQDELAESVILGLIWDLLKKKGLTYGLEKSWKDEGHEAPELAAYDAIEKLLNTNVDLPLKPRL